MIRTVQRKCQGCAKISDREDFIKITLNDEMHTEGPGIWREN